MTINALDVDGRKERKGGKKNCARKDCGREFDAFRDWDKYCSKKCGRKDRAERFWKNKLKVSE